MEELTKHQNNMINALFLSCGRYSYTPEIKVSFSSAFLEIYRNSDESKIRGVYEKIKEILSKRERKYKRVASSPWVVLIPVGGIIFTLLSPSIYISPLVAKSIFGLIIFISLTFSAVTFLEAGKHSIIVLKKRVDQDSFWKRNRDQIFLLLVGTALGVIGTILGSSILNALIK